MTRLDGFPARPPSMNALSAAKLSSSLLKVRSSRNTMKRNGERSVCSNSLGKFVICRGDISMIFRPRSAYSLATALTVEDLPVPLSP